MPKFFIEGGIRDTYDITGDDARHITGSLRMRRGDIITVCDGSGNDAECQITAADKDCVSLRVISRKTCLSEPSVGVTLYQCMPKGDKFDGVVRKCVELGVSRIVPVISSRVISRPDKKSLAKKIERWNKISKEAASQSGRGIVPEISSAQSFDEAIKEAAESDKGLFFYECGGKPLSEWDLEKSVSISLFIGPEGGFSPKEAEQAQQAGLITATLGPRILRTETAPVAALAIIMYIAGNME